MKFTAASHWSTHDANRIGSSKHWLSKLSLQVRLDQFKVFTKLLKPRPRTRILDVGTTPNESLPDSNFFEQAYLYPQQLQIASVENCQPLVSKYHLAGFTKIKPGKSLPFADQQFDIVTSWATLEHVGSWADQKFFLAELARVGKKIFVTTPDKYCIFEPHTQVFFWHWLPIFWYRRWLNLRHNQFWANPENWNPLGQNDLKRILPAHCQCLPYRSWGWLPSHLLVYKLATSAS